MALYKLTVEKYLEKLSGKIPAPGGGSASALVSAVGISLFTMCVRYSQKNFTVSEFKTLNRRLDKIKKELMELIEEDKNAYLELDQAYKNNADFRQLIKAKKKAGLVPARICEHSLSVLKIAIAKKDKIKKIFKSDYTASLKFLLTGLESAKIFVSVNCKGIKSLQAKLKKIDKDIKKVRKEIRNACENNFW